MSDSVFNNRLLGRKVQDQITGLRGIAVQVQELLNGTIQIAVQPRGDGEKVPDAVMIDYQTLQEIETGLADKVIRPKPSSFRLGEELQDRVSGFLGIAISRTVFINGCEYITIHNKIDKDGDSRTMFCAVGQLEKKSNGMAPKLDEPVVDPATKPGGPMTRLSATRAMKAS